MSEEHNADPSTETGKESDPVNRRNVLKMLGIGAGATIGSARLASTATAEEMDVEVTDLTGEEHEMAVEQALNDHAFDSIRTVFTEKGWGMERNKATSYRVDDGETESRTVMIPFDNGTSEVTGINWSSGQAPTTGINTSETSVGELTIIQYEYNATTDEVTTSSDSVGGVSAQHHGVCGVGRKIDVDCLKAYLGAGAAGIAACGACAQAGFNIGSLQCISCGGIILTQTSKYSGVNCSLCTNA